MLNFSVLTLSKEKRLAGVAHKPFQEITQRPLRQLSFPSLPSKSIVAAMSTLERCAYLVS